MTDRLLQRILGQSAPQSPATPLPRCGAADEWPMSYHCAGRQLTERAQESSSRKYAAERAEANRRIREYQARSDERWRTMRRYSEDMRAQGDWPGATPAPAAPPAEMPGLVEIRARVEAIEARLEAIERRLRG